MTHNTMISENLNAVYIINAKKLVERRMFMERQLDQFGMQAEFISVFDIEELTNDIISKYFLKDNLSMEQMSCAMKHIFALQKIAKSESSFSLVLEDDAVFYNNFLLGLKLSLSESCNFIGNKVIYIGSANNFFTEKSKMKKGQHLYLASRGRFSDSYIIDSETAQKRLRWIEKNKISKPIDDQFDFIDLESGTKILWLEAPIVEQGSKNGLFRSEIPDTSAKGPQWLQGIRFRLQKIRRKYLYQIFR